MKMTTQYRRAPIAPIFLWLQIRLRDSWIAFKATRTLGGFHFANLFYTVAAIVWYNIS